MEKEPNEPTISLETYVSSRTYASYNILFLFIVPSSLRCIFLSTIAILFFLKKNSEGGISLVEI
jgi:hypothetical protein